MSGLSLKHIAFIMDGNGRWAVSRGLKRSDGHREGVKALKKVLSACAAQGVPVVSVYAFSTENWKRPKEETDSIFSLIRELNDDYLTKEELNYSVNFFGDIAALPLTVRNSVEKARKRTQKNRGMTVNVMLNYGGRAEIVNSVKKLVKDGKEISEESISANLYTGYLPEPDIIVRTAGERRLSNFMIFQCAYSEFMFIDKLWPDMDGTDVSKILEEYGKRKRRFGGI